MRFKVYFANSYANVLPTNRVRECYLSRTSPWACEVDGRAAGSWGPRGLRLYGKHPNEYVIRASFSRH